jgi:deoxyribodipyrimidine photo-lyase
MLILHWFRRDLRLDDNLSLQAAAETGATVLPVFCLDPALVRNPWVSRPRLAFLLQALASLDADLRAAGSRLLLVEGDPLRVLPEVIWASGVQALHLNRDYTGYARERDQRVQEMAGVPVQTFDDAVLLPPGSVLTDAGLPYTVFTPFKKKWLTMPKQALAVAPVRFLRAGEIDALTDKLQIKQYAQVPSLADYELQPTVPAVVASTQAAQRRLKDFLDTRAAAYSEGRNRLAADGTDDTLGGSSFLSPYFRFGLLSPRQAYWGARAAYPQFKTDAAQRSIETWVSELVWRDFYMHILHHFPHVQRGSFRREYDQVQWREAPADVAAWKAGMTGFPVVDAAMRQLQAMSWMPNRARMIVASFLTKDLLIDWRVGERHFMDWLIDGDPAANNGGWQWSAGTGTDAQPYFRIFNPASQAQQFDPEGVYIRRWVPELRGQSVAALHDPLKMTQRPSGYPAPMVDRRAARERTLAAFKAVRGE